MSYDIDSHWMLYLSPLFMGTSIYAARCGFIVLSLAEWMIIISSIYYWSKHTSQFRRKVDIIIVQISFYIHLYYAIKYKSPTTLFFISLVVITYLIGLHYNSNIAHAFVWIFGCCGMISLVKHLCKINETEDICLLNNFCKKKLRK